MELGILIIILRITVIRRMALVEYRQIKDDIKLSFDQAPPNPMCHPSYSNPSRCCAVISGNLRCSNNVIGESKHCEIHNADATRLYLKYKKICNQIDKFQLNRSFSTISEQIKYLLKYIDILTKAHTGRLVHRQYAFVPECQDEGHELQFKILERKIIECENKLQTLFDKEIGIQKSEPTDQTDSSETQSNSIITEAKKKVDVYRKKRQSDAAEEAKLIETYM